MAEEPTVDTRAQELNAAMAAAVQDDRLDFSDLMKVHLSVSAELGRSILRVRDVLDLKVGSLVTLDKMAGEMTDIFVNGLHLARGEVVVIGDVLHVRVAEVCGSAEGTDRDYA